MGDKIKFSTGTVVDSDGNLYQTGTQITATAAELNAAADVSSRLSTASASGAISTSTRNVTLDSSGSALAMTVSAVPVGEFMTVYQEDSGTQGHTVTLDGAGAITYDGTNYIATTNAKGECLVLFGAASDRFIIVENIGSVALGTT